MSLRRWRRVSAGMASRALNRSACPMFVSFGWKPVEVGPWPAIVSDHSCGRRVLVMRRSLRLTYSRYCLHGYDNQAH